MLVTSRLAGIAARSILVLLVAGLLGATLVGLAPGFETDERLLDPHLLPHTLEALRQERAIGNPITFYVGYLARLARGDAGRSIVFGQPVVTLIRHRAPITLRTVALGLTVGWISGLLAATAAALSGSRLVAALALTLSASLLCIPSAVLATLCLMARLPPAAAISAVVFPRVFAHASQQIRAAMEKPHLLMARARGVPPLRAFAFHVVPGTLWPMIALVGVSAPLALGAAIPIEALADSPGLGQLAWRAALGRDLQVLVCITLTYTIITVLCNALADVVTVTCFSRRGPYAESLSFAQGARRAN